MTLQWVRLFFCRQFQLFFQMPTLLRKTSWRICSVDVIFFALLMMSLVNDRYGSWVRADDGSPTEVKSVWTGILLPTALSIGLFILYKFQT